MTCDPYKFPEWVTVGASFRDETSPLITSPVRTTHPVWHIRAFVDGQAVMRAWSRHKQCWRYSIEIPYWFYIRRDNIVPLKKGEASVVRAAAAIVEYLTSGREVDTGLELDRGQLFDSDSNWGFDPKALAQKVITALADADDTTGEDNDG